MLSSVGTHSTGSEAHLEFRSDSTTVAENHSKPKLFVLDTNVILHDAQCLFRFHEHDIAVPITVLEELDQFKKGDSDIHFQARQFLRSLDELAGNVMSNEGAPLGIGLGSFRVLMNLDFRKADHTLMSNTADHRILKSALAACDLLPECDVILVTKDTTLRLKAKAFGLVAQDYNNDKIRHLDDLYTGKRIFNDVPSQSIRLLYEEPGELDPASLPIVDDPISNENFILRNGSRSVLVTYNGIDRLFRRISRMACFGIKPRNAEQSFALQALTDPCIRLVTLTGRAGSGKTLMALAAALESRSEFRQILLARPIVPLSNRDLGFLPGDVHAKIEPYMQPLLDNLNVLKHENRDSVSLIQQMLDDQRLEITPLAYIRGRSLQQTFFIVDEAQNLTPHEVKTIVTRAGEGTKIVLTGDLQQIDHPYLDSTSNGLTYVINRMKGQHLHAHVTLEKGVRSELSELAGALL
ncbi:MAG: PhoH family protein [Planctomycetaceae bacterium]|nr:PhoH family protein [Planctomycetaceae bacterium]